MGRYLLTGAAGFIGSHLARDAARAGPRGRRRRLLHAATTRARSRRQTSRRPASSPGSALHDVDLVEADLDGAGRGRRRHLPPGRPGRACGQLGRGLLDLRAPQHPGHPAGLRGRRAARAEGRVRLVVVDLRQRRDATRRGRTTGRAALALRRDQARLRAPGAGLPASLGLDFAALRYFTVYGPRQRPDMAMARIVYALVDGDPFEIYGDGEQSREFTFVADAVRRHDRRDGRPEGRASTTSAGAPRRR